MATYPKRPIVFRSMGDAFVAYAKRRHWEGANQTFVPHAPLVMTGGYIVEAASPSTAIFGFALQDAHNVAAGASLIEFLPAIDGLEFNANFLGADAANNTLAAADFGGSYDLIKKSDYFGTGKAGWFVQDAAAAAAVKMVRAETDVKLATEVDNSYVKAGDINARPTFVVLSSVRTYE